jgi:hypothetical protein
MWAVVRPGPTGCLVACICVLGINLWSTNACCVTAASPHELLRSSRPFHLIGKEEDVKRMPCAFIVIVHVPLAGGERRSCNGHTLLVRLSQTLDDGTVYTGKRANVKLQSMCGQWHTTSDLTTKIAIGQRS